MPEVYFLSWCDTSKAKTQTSTRRAHVGSIEFLNAECTTLLQQTLPSTVWLKGSSPWTPNIGLHGPRTLHISWALALHSLFEYGYRVVFLFCHKYVTILSPACDQRGLHESTSSQSRKGKIQPLDQKDIEPDIVGMTMQVHS